MSFQDLIKRSEKFTIDNSPLILTGVAVAGTVATAYLAGRATWRARGRLEDESPYSPRKEKLKKVWKLYIPPVVVGGLTVAAVVGANRIGTQRAAALAAAYALSERAFTDYKDKVLEKIGPDKEEEVRAELAQEYMSRHPELSREVQVIDKQNVLCLDSFSGRHFENNVEAIRRAETDIRRQILDEHYASLNEFWALIGLSPTQYGEEVGWNFDSDCSISISTALAADGRPCVVLNYNTWPIRSYFQL